MSPRRTLPVLVAGSLGLVTVGAMQTGRRWARAVDPCGDEDRDLPAGEPFQVTTDDGAVLDGVVLGDAGGPVVLLAHCWMGNRTVWAPVANRLVASGHRVVLYDQRGHGASTWGTAEITVDRLGADLGAVLDTLDVRDATVAGHSMGGMAIMAYLASHPTAGRVSKAVLVSTGASQIVSRPARVAGARVFGNRRVERLVQSPLGPALVRTSVGRRPVLAHLQANRANMLGTPADVRLACFTAICSMDLRSGLDAVEVPTTVVVGTRDLLTPVRRAREIADSIPGARLVTIPDAGHMLPFEAPDLLVTEVAR